MDKFLEMVAATEVGTGGAFGSPVYDHNGRDISHWENAPAEISWAEPEFIPVSDPEKRRFLNVTKKVRIQPSTDGRFARVGMAGQHLSWSIVSADDADKVRRWAA